MIVARHPLPVTILTIPMNLLFKPTVMIGVCVLIFIMSLAVSNADAIDIYVAVTGDDTKTGSLFKPFATLSGRVMRSEN